MYIQANVAQPFETEEVFFFYFFKNSNMKMIDLCKSCTPKLNKHKILKQ